VTPVPAGCSLAAAARAGRGAAWRAVVAPALLERRPAPGGVRLRLRRSAPVEQALAGLVAAERDCCGHLTFRVTADGDAVTVDITGPAEVVPSIRRAFGGPPAAVEPARPEDLPSVLELLAAAGLPREGVADHFADFLVARADGAIVGGVGLEPYGEAGLLRSLVVAEARRGAGLGRALVEALLAAARRRSVRRVFLLTETAADFFPALGFRRVERDEADPAVRRSVEFLAACPRSAVCMRLDLDRGV
jgi:amino-acid N-acetyltransferase